MSTSGDELTESEGEDEEGNESDDSQKTVVPLLRKSS